jgi:WD40 repeat protein
MRRIVRTVLFGCVLFGWAAEVSRTQEARPGARPEELPQGAVGRLGSPLLRHECVGGGLHVVFAPDSTFFVSTNYQTLRFWDCQTGQMLRQIGPEEGVGHSAIAFSPDGSRLASSSYGGKVRILSARTGKVENEWKFGQPSPRSFLDRIRFSSDGASLFGMEAESSILVLDSATGHLQKQLTIGAFVYGYALSLDGKTVRTWNTQWVSEWDLDTEEELLRSAFPIQRPQLRRWAPMPDGSLFAVSDGKVIVFWDPWSGQEKGRLTDLGADPWDSLRFTPDGKRLLTAHHPEKANIDEVRVWSVAEPRLERSFPVSLRYAGLHLSPDGKTLVLASHYPVIGLWDFATGKPRLIPQGHFQVVLGTSFTPDGRTLVTGSYGETLTWDTATGKLGHRFDGHFQPVEGWTDSRSVWLIEQTKEQMQERDLASGKEKRTVTLAGLGVDSWLSCARFSTDRRSLLGVSMSGVDTRLHVWDRDSGREVEARPLQSNGMRLAAFVNEARVASITHPRNDTKDRIEPEPEGPWLHIEDRQGKRTILHVPMPSGWGAEAVEGDPGRWVATICTANLRGPDGDRFGTSFLHLREETSGGIRLEIQRKSGKWTGYFSHLAVSPDRRTLATAWDPDEIQLWDVFTGKELLRRKADARIYTLTFSPDGKLLATGLYDGSTLLWDVSAVTARPQPRRALSAAERDEYWKHLDGEAKLAHAALAALLGDPQQAVALLRERVRPVEPVPAERVQKLLAALDAADFDEREAAARQLQQLGERAEPALRAALEKNPSAEVKRQLRELLEDPWKVRSPEALRVLRAIEVLDHIGSPEAKALLERLAKGDPLARETQAARTALDRAMR